MYPQIENIMVLFQFNLPYNLRYLHQIWASHLRAIFYDNLCCLHMVTHTSNIKLQNFDQIFNLEGAEYNVAFEMGWTFWLTSERCISWTFAFSRLKRRMIDFWTLERATLFFHDTNGPQSGRAQCVDFKDNNFYILFTQCLLHWNVSNFRPFCSEVS